MQSNPVARGTLQVVRETREQVEEEARRGKPHRWFIHSCPLCKKFSVGFWHCDVRCPFVQLIEGATFGLVGCAKFAVDSFLGKVPYDRKRLASVPMEYILSFLISLEMYYEENE